MFKMGQLPKFNSENEDLRNSMTDSALILTKLRRDSVFAAMSSKMNVVIWKEFSFNRKSRGSSSFLQREEAKKILGNELVTGSNAPYYLLT